MLPSSLWTRLFYASLGMTGASHFLLRREFHD